MAKIFLKPKKDQALRRLHPWIFSGAIRNIEGEAKDGAVVSVFSSQGDFLAKGHYQEGSIAVRILTYREEELGAEFWRSRFENALSYRRKLGIVENPETTCFRFIHGAGDRLPGLVVDVYGDTAVLQCHSIGMHIQRELIAKSLVEVLQQVTAVYDKSEESLPPRYASEIENGCLVGKSEPQVVLENGNSFFVDWESGQKTGFFIDQRDNRQMLARYVPGKRVLNAFCYSGGFSVYALQAGASQVHSIDLSAKAMEWTDKNVDLISNAGNHESFTGDVQQFLKSCERYDVVVIDPPAFAKHPRKRHKAVQGYKRLNASAMKKVNDGGLLFTFSCSQVIDRQLFTDTIVAAALEAGRSVRLMHHLSQATDHPVNIFQPEGSYLKGLVLEVRDF